MAEESLKRLKGIQEKVKHNLWNLKKQLEFWQELDDFLADTSILLENIKPFFNLIGNTQPILLQEKEEVE